MCHAETFLSTTKWHKARRKSRFGSLEATFPFRWNRRLVVEDSMEHTEASLTTDHGL